MPENQATKLVAIILIVMAAVLFIGAISIWMMPSMMGGTMGGCVMCMAGPVLLAA